MLHISEYGKTFAQQLKCITEAEKEIKADAQKEGLKVRMKRIFLSDIANQKQFIPVTPGENVSIIQQPPLDGTKIAMLMYMNSGSNNTWHWTSQTTDTAADCYGQTTELLQNFCTELRQSGMTLADNCIRTWFYVRDVDTEYKGLVDARNDVFKENGLTKETHYIASTGIGGQPAGQNTLVQMDAVAVEGLHKGQMNHLYAPTHLNATHEYGVAFERGTTLTFGDRKKMYISGTASINNRGEVLHVGDIKKQTLRMWDNVEALLQEAGAGFKDVMQMTVYLRDMADYVTVKRMYDERFRQIPVIFTLAPVCRPQWLIEMECIAITEDEDKRFANF